MEFAATRLGENLNLARALEYVHPQKSLGSALPDCQKSMVAQDQVLLVPQVCDQPWLFFFILGEPFVIVIREGGQWKHRLL
jgi:hypothetical protein